MDSFPMAGAKALEQQEIQTDDGVLYVHFGEAEPFYFEVEQMQPAEPLKEQLPPHRPKMNWWDRTETSFPSSAELPGC